MISTEENARSLNFEILLTEPHATHPLPDLQEFEARDKAVLKYRFYPSNSRTALILVHGSGTDSKYLGTLAHELAESGAAAVYTPDLRGHGPTPTRRGDIDYIEQLEDDLADLIAHIQGAGVVNLVIGGHSSGGGLVTRFAGGKHGHFASGYLLLAPYFGHDAPTVRDDSGGWAQPSVAKIIVLSILNGFGIKRFDSARVLRFNLPPEYRDGSETLAYSFRLMTGFNPSNFRTELSSIKVPITVILGAKDEALFADRFESTVRPLVPHANIATVEEASHLGLVVSESGIAAAREWLEKNISE